MSVPVALFRAWFACILTAIGWLLLAPVALGQTQQSARLIAGLESELPAAAERFDPSRPGAVSTAAQALEASCAALAEFRGLRRPEQFVAQVEDLLAVKAQVDALLDRTLQLRGRFIELNQEQRRELLRSYLAVTSALVDLSGRLRYLLHDALYAAALEVAPRPQAREHLIDLLLRYRSSIGAAVMADSLFDPEETTLRGAKPASPSTKLKLLQLLAATGQSEMLPDLIDFAEEPDTPSALVLAAVDAIRRIGLPQNPRPGQDPTLPEPAITARELYALLARLNRTALTAGQVQQRNELLKWLRERAERGIAGDSYKLDGVEVRAGDWLLMRNPSPYNHFTDLGPGLFTHVGVITSETGSDGIRRMVLVDLPERGKQLQATNLDVYVQRTLHYVVLRHRDPQVGATMAKVARRVIGNPSQFDLNFRTARVEELRGVELEGRLIHTYCAGLLLLCAQETGAPRSDFFPIAEHPAGGRTVENLARLGLSFGDNFISPTGALFSPQLETVGRRESMYEPGREIQEAVFAHFADRLADQTLAPAPDLFQALRLRVAEMSKQNPLLAKAVAEAAGVSENLDLVAAAKAAAVVETLDEIAGNNSLAFHHAREALLAGPPETLRDAQFSPEEIAAIAAYRKRHEPLYNQWASGRISPRVLRIQLVEFYVEKGKRQLDERFFSPAR